MLRKVRLRLPPKHIMKKKFFVIVSAFFFKVHAWTFFGSETPAAAEKPAFTIMIDPAGDAQNPGRIIDDTFERSLTMQCAEELKQLLEKDHSIKCRVILTRFAGETIEPFQSITFANRLGVDLYISLNFFQQSAESPQFYFYTLIYDPASDFAAKKGTTLELLPYDQAYKLSLTQTKHYSTLAFAQCKEVSSSYHVTCHSPKGIPYKPLSGIMAPAFGIEIGIHHKNQAKSLAPLVAQTLKAIVSS